MKAKAKKVKTFVEPALNESELRYRRLFEAAQDGILILNAKTGAITDVNPYLIDMLGYSRDEFVDKKLWKVGAFKDIKASKEAFEALQKDQYIRYEDLPLKAKDGHLVQVEFVSNVYSVNSHKVIQCSIRDITSRKRIEEALQQSEARYRGAMDAAGLVPYVIDYKTKQFTYIGNNIFKLTGYGEEEFTPAILKEIVQERNAWQLGNDGLNIEEAQGKFLAGAVEQWRNDLRIRARTGEERWINDTSIPLRDENGNVTGAIGIFQDITERERSEEKIKTILRTAMDGFYMVDMEGRILEANDSYCSMIGYSREELLTMSVKDIEAVETEEVTRKHIQRIIENGSDRFETKHRRKDGSDFTIEASVKYLKDETRKLVVFMHDITGRKQAEEKLAQERNLLRSLIDHVPDYIYVKDTQGRFLIANPALARLMAASTPDALLGKTDFDFYPQKLAAKYYADEQAIFQSGQPVLELEEPTVDTAGNERWISTTKVPLRDAQGKIFGLVGMGRDITERKRAEEELAKEHNLLLTLINNLPDVIYAKDIQGHKIISNTADWQASGGKRMEDVLGKTDFDTYPAQLAAQFWADDKMVLDSGQPIINREEPGRDSQGNPKWTLTTKVPLRDDNSQVVVGLVGIGHDITERKQAEEALKRSEEQYRSLFSHLPIPAFTKDINGIYTSINEENLKYWATSPIGHTDVEILPDEIAAALQANDQSVIKSGEPNSFEEFVQNTPMGDRRFISNKVPLRDSSENIIGILGVSLDITERKRAEEALRQRARELQLLYETSLEVNAQASLDTLLSSIVERAASLIGTDSGGLYLMEPDGASLKLVVGHNLPKEFVGVKLMLGEGLSGKVAQNGERLLVENYQTWSGRAEAYNGYSFSRVLGIPLNIKGRVIGVINVSDFTRTGPFSEDEVRLVGFFADQAALAIENARLHQETLHQVKRLEALHAIDQYIAGSFDQRLTLELLLTHTLDQLEVDAAVIFLLEPYQRILQYAVGKGFHTRIIETANLRLGDSFAGRAVMERRMIHVSDQEASEPYTVLAQFWLEEGMKSMYSVPLIAKGQVKGVLNVYHRRAFTPDQPWINFLETLAGQAAIAVDSIQLFNGLQQANMELSVAYDATIEGWSQAMDLRDKETEGHTKRVTEMSMQIGKAMQLGEEYLVHMRRGALLHDIGKLGVPDAILLKPDKLTDEEWQIMKKHPQFAYDMLHSVAYLHRALDIPYCHHEKWDGTGYPQGLKGEQIPLAARIFAIVDVWDALTSDRPYRQAWSKPDALNYIREQSGKYFDPQVVEIFLKEFGSEST